MTYAFIPLTALALAALALPAAAQQTQTTQMAYSDCLTSIAMVSTSVGMTPQGMRNDPGLTVVRFDTEDGQITVTCSREAGTRVLEIVPEGG